MAAEIYEESASYAEGELELQWRQRALELRSGKDAPQDPDARWARFGSLAGIGKVKLDEGDLDDAEKYLHDALEIGDELIGNFPNNLVWIDGLVDVYGYLGNVERAREDHDASLRWFRKAVRMIIRGREMAPESDMNRWIGREAFFRNDVGRAIYFDGRVADSIDEFTRAANLKNELNSERQDWARQIIAWSHNYLGYAYSTQGWDDIRRSAEAFATAVEIVENLNISGLEKRIENYQVRRDAAQQLLEAHEGIDDDDP